MVAEVGTMDHLSPRIARSGGERSSAAARPHGPGAGKLVLSWAVVLLGLAALVMMAAYSYITMPLTSPADARAAIVTIPQGVSSQTIANMLEEYGLIRDSRHFQFLSRLHGFESKLQAGDYLLSSDMNLRAVMNALRYGSVHAERVTIHEGLHLRQIADVLSARGLVDRERFLMLASDERLVYGDQPPIDKPHPSLEGYLFPDTYFLSPSMTEEQIIRIMVDRFIDVVMPVVEGRAAPLGMNLHEVVTLASIVEKEALLRREQPIIASVFINRLSIDMPLQADPTIAYLFDEHRTRLLYADLEIASPYNTYRNRGLPPGPIASPGLSAIEAVLEPADTDLFFFVARGDGSHVFTRTFNEHVRVRQQLGR